MTEWAALFVYCLVQEFDPRNCWHCNHDTLQKTGLISIFAGRQPGKRNCRHRTSKVQKQHSLHPNIRTVSLLCTCGDYRNISIIFILTAVYMNKPRVCLDYYY